MVDKRSLCLVNAICLMFIFLTMADVVPAEDGLSVPIAVASIGPRKDPSDFEQTLNDYAPIPEWLSLVLNWLPSENRNDEIAALEGEFLGINICEIVTSPTETEPKATGLHNIPPLYVSPKLDGEGVWVGGDTPIGGDGKPLVYKTVYRPSVDFPNTVVYMAVFDMSRLKTRLFVGQNEPGIYKVSGTNQKESLTKLVAVTNAMWMQRHSKGAGLIYRGKVVYPMVPGMATLVVYQDDSVDVLEWTNEIPLSCVKDARQLSYLILRNGQVVDKVLSTKGDLTDSEIGMGDRLIDKGGKSTIHREYWFLANRTAFGVRDDGNLVFAMGHHVSTKDLARALALAGCKRGIHADANIHNVVCNFYFRDKKDRIVKRDALSPDQLEYTLNRYDNGYTKDFFAFYEK